MKRRSFIAGLLGVAAAGPALAVARAPAPKLITGVDLAGPEGDMSAMTLWAQQPSGELLMLHEQLRRDMDRITGVSELLGPGWAGFFHP